MHASSPADGLELHGGAVLGAHKGRVLQLDRVRGLAARRERCPARMEEKMMEMCIRE